MKKLICMMMAVLLALSVTGCGSTGGDTTEPFTPQVLEQLVEAGVFSEELEVLEGDIPFALYALADRGLTLKDLEQAAAVRSAGATCEEGAVLIFTDEEKAQLAAQALGDYVENQILSNENYRPQEIPKLEQARILVRENTVLLLVAADGEAARAVLGE